MKIGFFGNTNNYPFMLAMLLQDMGHSLFFVVTEKLLLHRPESRYHEFQKRYPDWIMDLSHLTEWDFISLHPDLAGALAQLSNCDALILNSVGPSLLPFLNKPAIALLTGSDLSDYANPLTVEARTAVWDQEYKETPEGKNNIAILQDFITRQRMGIQSSIAVRWFPKGSVPVGDQLLDEIGIPDSKRHFFAMANLDQLEFSPAPHNQPIRVFCGMRLTWKFPIEAGRMSLDYKGGDVMIRGLGLFYRETSTRLNIRLVRKGLHLKETEELIAEEGIGDQVIWSEEMSLVDYWHEIAQADIIFDQLAKSLPGAPVYDAMAVGRPVISSARHEVSGILEISPICQAETAEEVCQQLKRLVFNPKEREDVGRLGRQYVEKYFDPQQSARQIEAIFQDALNNRAEIKDFFTIAYTYILETFRTLRHESQQELTQTQQELTQTQQELAQTQQELAQTQQEFAQTQQELAQTQQYAIFFKPFRFLKKIMVKLPIVNKIFEEFPEE